jgi:protein-disulfide isomerase
MEQPAPGYDALLREIMKGMVLAGIKTFRMMTLALSLVTIGCHAQMPPPADGTLSLDLQRRIEILIRSRSDISPEYEIKMGPRTKSDIPGFDLIAVTFSRGETTSKPVTFLLSADNKTLAQFNKFDISKDPKELVTAENRPARGGPANAPVVIVGFDDLECPYCAKMHSQLFPAILDRYKDQVRVVYLDFPLTEIHPWAMRASVNVNCLATQSPLGYWKLVDYIHAHAADMGGNDKSVATANATLDSLTIEEGKRQNVDIAKLKACIEKQDDTAIKASVKEGDTLGVHATPALFINGEKVEGALPIEYVYQVIDRALRAAGQTPPTAPAPLNTTTPQAMPAAKPGN